MAKIKDPADMITDELVFWIFGGATAIIIFTIVAFQAQILMEVIQGTFMESLGIIITLWIIGGLAWISVAIGTIMMIYSFFRIIKKFLMGFFK